MASRVVPGMSLTIARCWPSKRVEQRALADVRPADDRQPRRPLVEREGRLLGSAWRQLAPAAALLELCLDPLALELGGSDSGGSAQTITSSRSATPRPWSALIGCVSGQPRTWNSAASISRRGLSALLAATITGARAVRRTSAASWSAGVRPASRIDHEDDHVGLADRQPRLLLDALLDRRRRGASRARPCRRR